MYKCTRLTFTYFADFLAGQNIHNAKVQFSPGLWDQGKEESREGTERGQGWSLEQGEWGGGLGTEEAVGGELAEENIGRRWHLLRRK
jgi:hypothetical protein